LAIDVPVEIHRNLKCTKKSRPDYRNRIYGKAADPLQYIMFTSGSTGDPKGVQTTQQAVKTFLTWVLRDYGFDRDTVFMNQAPFTFDISLYDVLGAFALGATAVLNSSEVCREQDQFLKRITHYGCTVWNSTPSFVFIYLRHPSFNSLALPKLQTIMLLGEELPHRTAGLLKKQFAAGRLINAYGPTEATVATTWVELSEEMIQKYKSLPIGYAMPGAELLIEKASAGDKNGELIIVGDHVSIGYLKNDPLNATKFFTHQGKRAFRTGDLAYEENGLFFFDGRNDDQVKMHGFRIELQEISAVLCRHTGIADAITLPLRRNGEIKKLVSFVILQNGLSAEALKPTLLPELKKTLPYYMVPGDLVAVNQFPYSTSHKIDRNKLIEGYLIQQTGA
jgi:D-alanine--poly(phosphoribitol) ligase subunit 1